MKKTLIWSIALLIVLVSAVGCAKANSKKQINHEEIVIRAHIYSDELDGYYCFLLTLDKELYAFKQDMESDRQGVPESFFEDGDVIVEGVWKIARLTDEQFDEVRGIVDNLGEFQGVDYMILDSWGCSVILPGSDYANGHYFTYGGSVNNNYNLLITKLIELSPMKICDDDGDEVKPHGWIE